MSAGHPVKSQHSSLVMEGMDLMKWKVHPMILLFMSTMPTLVLDLVHLEHDGWEDFSFREGEAGQLKHSNAVWEVGP